jgi:protein TonB
MDRTQSEETESSNCETNIVTSRRGDFGFLRSNDPAPFAVRLAIEVSEAFRALTHDPLAFIRMSSGSSVLSHDRRSGMRSGLTVAVVFYAAALTAVYASYSIVHRVKPSASPALHLEITYLASPPVPVKKALPRLKETAGTPGHEQFAAPIKPEQPHKAVLTEAKPTPIPPNETLTDPALTSNSQTSETASRASSEGVARGLTGNGVGTASNGGTEAASTAGVNYNDVFSMSSVTTRPQILSRPVPGYTDEARRAQIEGQVKLSVVLSASGTISEIKVIRGLGYGLDEKAVEAAKELRFVPAQKDGHTVSVRVFLEFKFSLL